MIGWTVNQFWEAKPVEFRLAVAAYVDREERQLRMLAWHAANLMQMWAKKGSKITVDRLLGKQKSDFLSPYDFDRWADKARKRKREAEGLE